MPRALITGVTGQDGSYLAEQLLEKGYEVFGLVRRLSTPNLTNLARLMEPPRSEVFITLLDGDLMDQSSLDAAVKTAQPDEVYNLAAQSFVGVSFNQPVLTGEATGLGAVRLLEAVRRFADKARFYQASSSEMFGSTPAPQSESTPFHPRSPYGAAKLYAHSTAIMYREAYGMFVSCGILFNHESPRRGAEFVTRKITLWAAQVAAGRRPIIELGDLSARRDWGYAPDYTDLMYRTLQHSDPGTFVGATGETHTVEEFLNQAIGVACAGPLGEARALVRSGTPANMRPSDVVELCGDARYAKRELGWEPRTDFHQLVRLMVNADLARLGGRATLSSDGRPVSGAASTSG